MRDPGQPRATLTVTRGLGAGRRLEIGAVPVTLGRHDQCEIQVQDTWVSRQHARIAWSGTAYVVEDLGSTNGTFVNDERVVAPRALRSGDVLRLGDEVELAFHMRVSAPAQEVPEFPGVAPQAYAPVSPAPPGERSVPRRRRSWLWALVVVGVLLILGIGAGAYFLLSSEKEQWVVFASTQADEDDDQTNETNIFMMRPDGTEVRQVTSYSGSDWTPDLSPDGQTVVFASGRNTKSGIHTVRVDGTELESLTPAGGDHSDPSWSPDGQQIVFVSNGDVSFEIYAMNADGSEATRLTYHESGCRDPDWSPDGKRIAYSCFSKGSGYDIYVMDADGGNTQRITDGLDFELEPSWSPDGKRIAYSCWYMDEVEEGRGFNIFTLTTSRSLMLLYTGSDIGIEMLESGIHTMAADGSDMEELAVTEGSRNWAPAWSPGGETILFASDRDGDADIYTLDLASLELTNLTNNESDEYTPNW